jgi:hypothetical protein
MEEERDKERALLWICPCYLNVFCLASIEERRSEDLSSYTGTQIGSRDNVYPNNASLSVPSGMCDQWWANLDQASKDLDKTIFRDLSPTPIP